MLTSKPRNPGTFKMRCPAGKLVAKPACGMRIPKWQKFYNWPRNKDGSPMEDKPGFPAAEDIPEMLVDAPKDQWHALICHKGPCSVVDDSEPALKKKKGDK